jgi:hypothetical protein
MRKEERKEGRKKERKKERKEGRKEGRKKGRKEDAAEFTKGHPSLSLLIFHFISIPLLPIPQLHTEYQHDMPVH